MQGIAAINAANGWVMALTGAIIVMTGLATLSFIISQLHKIVELIEKKTQKPARPEKKTSADQSPSPGEMDLLSDLAATARIVKPMSAGLGDSFELTKLYQVMEKENLPHPHITIRALREAGYLASTGEGSFAWQNI